MFLNGLTSVQDPLKYADYKHMKNGKPTLRKKDQHYLETVLKIPENDAKVLAKVIQRARAIDGTKIGPMRLGVSTIVGFFPA